MSSPQFLHFTLFLYVKYLVNALESNQFYTFILRDFSHFFVPWLFFFYNRKCAVAMFKYKSKMRLLCLGMQTPEATTRLIMFKVSFFLLYPCLNTRMNISIHQVQCKTQIPRSYVQFFYTLDIYIVWWRQQPQPWSIRARRVSLSLTPCIM